MNGTEVTGLPSGYGMVLLQTLLALGAVCLLAYVVLRFGVKRLYGLGRPGRLLNIVEKLPLDPQRALFLVEVAGRYVLLGTSESGVRFLTDVDGERVTEVLERDAARAAPTSSRASRSPDPE